MKQRKIVVKFEKVVKLLIHSLKKVVSKLYNLKINNKTYIKLIQIKMISIVFYFN